MADPVARFLLRRLTEWDVERTLMCLQRAPKTRTATRAWLALKSQRTQRKEAIMRRLHKWTVSLATVLFAAAPAFADGATVKETKPGLLAKAKITPDAATAAAQAKVPKGTIQSAEIEEEHGKLIYSFDVKTEGKSGIDEVNVDARTGRVRVMHETPKDEANEAAKDAKNK